MSDPQNMFGAHASDVNSRRIKNRPTRVGFTKRPLSLPNTHFSGGLLRGGPSRLVLRVGSAGLVGLVLARCCCVLTLFGVLPFLLTLFVCR